jgi:hypothetical protein
MANWDNLRKANVARDIEWAGGIRDYTWRACELAGEIGEIRDAVGTHQSWDKRETHILPELADGVICIDLTAMTLGLPEVPIHSAGIISGSIVSFADSMGLFSLRLCNVLKKLERERRGWPGSRETKERAGIMLTGLMGNLGLMADYYHLDLRAGTAAKFNETSNKVGLTTRLVFS